MRRHSYIIVTCLSVTLVLGELMPSAMDFYEDDYVNFHDHAHHNGSADYFSETETSDLVDTSLQCAPVISNGTVITIGFVSSFALRHGVGIGIGALIAGAIPYAVDVVNNDTSLLPHHKLKFVAGDGGDPDTSSAIRTMTRMREQGAIAFIGLDNSCASEALVAAAWNYPLITYICLVVANNPSEKQIEEAFIPLAKLNGINITSKHYLPGDYLRKDNSTIEEVIDSTYDKIRIYVILSDVYTLVNFARVMQERNLIDEGQHMVVSVEKEEVYDPGKALQYCRTTIDEGKALNSTTRQDGRACRGVLVLTPSMPTNPHYGEFRDSVLQRGMRPPFNIPFHPIIKLDVPIYAGFAFDAVLLYARALTRVIADGGDITNGTAIVMKMRCIRYESILGFSTAIDEDGEAEGNYTLLSWQSIGEGMQPVGTFEHTANDSLPTLVVNRKIHWINGDVPDDEPPCGFYNEYCKVEPNNKVYALIIVCCFIMIVASIFIIRYYRYEQKLACLLWKVDVKDVVLLRTSSTCSLQNHWNTINFQGIDLSRYASFNTSSSSSSSSALVTGKDEPYLETQIGSQSPLQGCSNVGFYKGNVVFMRRVYKKSIDLTRNIRKELIQVREMRHENINPFIGASVDAPHVCILTLYSARGSLQDVLKNEDLDLDTMFIASLVADLIKGMIYLHDSALVSHGNLTSSTCLVDSRWVLQITDYGLHEFKAGQERPLSVDQRHQQDLLWRAPELLRMMSPPSRGTQKGDVYSFGVILYEIMDRKGPWGSNALPVKCILDRITNPLLYGGQFYRPAVQELKCPDYIVRCMEECWQEEADFRPDFRLINSRLREMQSGLKLNIFDNMIAIMEKYAYNLEGLVQERTNQLLGEKKKTENLLLRMLPKPVAEQLKRGEQVEAETFDSVTIYFSDIVGFTSLSAVSTPLQIVDMLNDLYTCFDSIIGHYDVYKVETIGDAYMVVSGLPIANGDKHAGQIASMALHLLSAIQSFEIKHRPGERLKLRIGIHSGPCVAGVVGLKMPRYCLFGDTVNTASRMESSGEAVKIHVSETCKDILDKLGGYVLQERGLTPIKGKGEMRTYWLVGKSKPSTGSLSPFNDLANCVSPISQLPFQLPRLEGEGKVTPVNRIRKAHVRRLSLNCYTENDLNGNTQELEANGKINAGHVTLVIDDSALTPPPMVKPFTSTNHEVTPTFGALNLNYKSNLKNHSKDDRNIPSTKTSRIGSIKRTHINSTPFRPNTNC
ncbi:Guanylate cyclase 32E [Halotydeus destructor]|nr:Guanylate cyclase 32E [Halotydeus destructor]